MSSDKVSIFKIIFGNKKGPHMATLFLLVLALRLENNYAPLSNERLFGRRSFIQITSLLLN